MKKLTSTQAKNNFGEILTTSQREPVIVEKNGKPVGVVISYEAYKEYQQVVEKDRYWGELAEKSGKMLSIDESAKFLKSLGK